MGPTRLRLDDVQRLIPDEVARETDHGQVGLSRLELPWPLKDGNSSLISFGAELGGDWFELLKGGLSIDSAIIHLFKPDPHSLHRWSYFYHSPIT